MDEKTFLAEMETLLNLEEPLTMETTLTDLEEWDSLAALMFQSFVLKKTKKPLKPAALKTVATVSDLYSFVKN